MHQTIISKIGRAPTPKKIEDLMKEEKKERKPPKLSLRQLIVETSQPNLLAVKQVCEQILLENSKLDKRDNNKAKNSNPDK